MPADARFDLLSPAPPRVPVADAADWRHQPAGPKRSDYSDRLTKQLARGASHPAPPTSKAPPRPESRARGTDRPQPASRDDDRTPASHESPSAERPAAPEASEAPAPNDANETAASAPANETAESQESEATSADDEASDAEDSAASDVQLTIVETAPPIPWAVESSTQEPDPSAAAAEDASPVEPPAAVVELLVGDSAAATDQSAAPADNQTDEPAVPPAGFASGALMVEAAAATAATAEQADATQPAAPVPTAADGSASDQQAAEPDDTTQLVELIQDSAPAIDQKVEVVAPAAVQEQASKPSPDEDRQSDAQADDGTGTTAVAAVAQAVAATAVVAPSAPTAQPADPSPKDSQPADQTATPVAAITTSKDKVSADDLKGAGKRPVDPAQAGPAPDGKPHQEAAPTADAAPQAPASADALTEVSAPASGSTETAVHAPAGGGARPVEAPRAHHTASGQAQQGSESDLMRHAASALRAADGLNRPIRIRLTPPELGALRVEVAREAGQVSARFEVTTAAAHSALSDHLPALRESLGRAGVAVERIEVRLAEPSRDEGHSGDQRGSQQQQGQSQQQGEDQRRDQGRREAPEWAQAAATRRDGEGGKPAAPEPPAPAGRRGVEADLLDIQV